MICEPCPNPWCKHDQPPKVARRMASQKLYISCGDCSMDGPDAATEAEAIALWNDRLNSTRSPVKEPNNES